MQDYTLVLVLVGVLAAVGGSFCSAVVHRLHHDLPGLWTGRSACPHCKKVLGWKELVPIVSYFVQGGKCRGCGAKIGFKYPLMEMSWVVVGLVFVQKFYSTPEMVPLLVSAGWVLVLFWYDVLHMEVDERVVVSGMVLALGWAFFAREDPGLYAVGGLVGAGFYAVQYLASRGKWVGFGDVYLGAFMGLLLGWKLLLGALAVAYVLGLVVGIWMMLFRGAGRHTAVPMGAFLMPATLGMLYAGPVAWDWYWGLVGII